MTCKDCIHYEICTFGSIINKNMEKDCKRFKNKADVVEVVICIDCAYRRVPARCSLWMGTTGENDYYREHGDNFYCAFGTPKERRC